MKGKDSGDGFVTVRGKNDRNLAELSDKREYLVKQCIVLFMDSGVTRRSCLSMNGHDKRRFLESDLHPSCCETSGGKQLCKQARMIFLWVERANVR